MHTHTCLFDQLMESPLKHIFISKWLLVKFFTFYFTFFHNGPWVHGIILHSTSKRCVFIIPIVHARKNEKLSNRALRICTEYISSYRWMAVHKNRTVNLIHLKRDALNYRKFSSSVSIHRDKCSSSDKESFIRWYVIFNESELSF